MKQCNLFLISISILLNACIPKQAFQPNPPEFKNWYKSNFSDEDIKQEMLNCGHQNPYSPNRNDSMNDRAIKEVCMFNKGFKYTGGFKGICYIINWQDKPACVEYRKTHPNPPN